MIPGFVIADAFTLLIVLLGMAAVGIETWVKVAFTVIIFIPSTKVAFVAVTFRSFIPSTVVTSFLAVTFRIFIPSTVVTAFLAVTFRIYIPSTVVTAFIAVTFRIFIPSTVVGVIVRLITVRVIAVRVKVSKIFVGIVLLVVISLITLLRRISCNTLWIFKRVEIVREELPYCRCTTY